MPQEREFKDSIDLLCPTKDCAKQVKMINAAQSVVTPEGKTLSFFDGTCSTCGVTLNFCVGHDMKGAKL